MIPSSRATSRRCIGGGIGLSPPWSGRPPSAQEAGRATTGRLPTALAACGLVGREAEVAQVQACLERARGGQRQVLFVTGEAGIGKTALVEACVTALAAPETAWMGWGQCVEPMGRGRDICRCSKPWVACAGGLRGRRCSASCASGRPPGWLSSRVCCRRPTGPPAAPHPGGDARAHAPGAG